MPRHSSHVVIFKTREGLAVELPARRRIGIADGWSLDMVVDRVLAQEDRVKPVREAPQMIMSSAGILLASRALPEAVSEDSGSIRI
jgi:hypothetical protein